MQDCVILCGGASKRMKTDKALLNFNGYETLIEYQLDKFNKIFKNVYLSAKYKKINYKNFILDTSEIYSPIFALRDILDHFKTQIFIVCVDYIFLDKDIIKRLFYKKDKFDMVVPRDDDFVHYLCGFFNPLILDKIEEMIQNKNYKISNLAKSVKFKSIYFKEKQKFINLNYKSEYEKYKDLI